MGVSREASAEYKTTNGSIPRPTGVSPIFATMSFLIVGLGNPGTEYEKTRHNIGFDTLDAIAKKYAADWQSDKHGWINTFRFKGRTAHLLKPNTYMNLSGKAVSYWMQQHKIKLEHVLIVLDDLAIDLAAMRLRLKGSDGGHNGLKSIDQSLATQNYARLRFGIGNNFPRGKQVDFVLGKWKPEEEVPVLEGIDKAISLIEGFLVEQKATSL